MEMRVAFPLAMSEGGRRRLVSVSSSIRWLHANNVDVSGLIELSGERATSSISFKAVVRTATS